LDYFNYRLGYMHRQPR